MLCPEAVGIRSPLPRGISRALAGRRDVLTSHTPIFWQLAMSEGKTPGISPRNFRFGLFISAGNCRFKCD